MASKEDFFVTLCSNVLLSNHSNTIANFVTELPAPIVLDSDWKVGLSEIHFTNSWCNLRIDNEIRIKSAFADKDGSAPLNTYAAIPAGRYEDIEELVDEITSKLQQTTGNNVQKIPEFTINRFTRRLIMSYGYTAMGQPLIVEFDKELADMLGVSEGYRSSYAHEIVSLTEPTVDVNPVVSEDDKFESKRSYDLSGGIHSLFVYSDVVDFSIVGDTKAKLLRMVHVPAESKFGSAAIDRYENPHFLPLATKEINSIEIHIKDDSNETIGFAFGRVKLVLHFVRNG